MKLSVGVLAFGVAFAGVMPASADEAVVNGSFDGALGDWNYSSNVNRVLSAIGNLGVVDTVLPGAGSIVQSLFLEVGQYTLAFDSFFSGAGTTLSVSIAGLTESLAGSELSGHQSRTFDISSSGLYDLVFFGRARGNFASFVAVDNVSVSSVVAVPGPEAGAGLAGLAFGGLMLWAVTRRRATAGNAQTDIGSV